MMPLELRIFRGKPLPTPANEIAARMLARLDERQFGGSAAGAAPAPSGREPMPPESDLAACDAWMNRQWDAFLEACRLGTWPGGEPLTEIDF